MRRGVVVRRFRLRLFLVILVSGLLLLPYAPLLVSNKVSAQRAVPEAPRGQPRPGKPEGTFPNLDQIRREPPLPPEARPAIPSSTRSKKHPLVVPEVRPEGDWFRSLALLAN
jgi:hypothetical protein